MSRNSRDWTILLPVGLGPLDAFLPLRCGDLDTAQDKMRTLPGSIYVRDIATSGRKQETARVTDESEVGTLSLSCTEEAAGGLDRLRVIGCPFPIQRRSCNSANGRDLREAARYEFLSNPTIPYEHYAAVNLGERTLATPTATGVDKNDNTPAVTFPGIFSRRFPLTDKSPGSFDFGDDIPMSLVYCHNPLCGDCSNPCDRLYVLLRVQVDEITTQMDLHRSDDGGQTWINMNIPMELREPSAFLFCYQGSRLFIGEEDGLVYYSDNPEGEEWYEAVQLNELLDSAWATRMVSDGYAIFAIVGDANQTGVVRSVDAGLTWEYVIPFNASATGQIVDIAVAGNVVATYGQTGAGVAQVIYSYQKGNFQTWTSYSHASLPLNGAIGVANPNPFDPNRAWFYIMGEDTANDVQIWKASHPEEWQLIHEDEDFDVSADWQFCQIFLDGDGYIGWFHACLDTGGTLTLRTSDGGNSFVYVSLNNTAIESGAGRAILAVCPHDPDEGFIAWHSEEPDAGEG